jgi:hypothetical protein
MEKQWDMTDSSTFFNICTFKVMIMLLTEMTQTKTTMETMKCSWLVEWCQTSLLEIWGFHGCEDDDDDDLLGFGAM